MRLGVISTTALPTPPKGYGGIELLVWYLTQELAKRKYDIRLYASPGSGKDNVELVTGSSEAELADLAYRDVSRGEVDVVLDWSHTKHFSSLYSGSRVLSQVFWTDARGINPVYPSRAVASAFNDVKGNVIYPGIDLSRYVFRRDREDWFLYLGRIIPEKAVERVIAASRATGIRLVVAGHTGDFSYDKNYVNLIKSMCRGRVEWVGDVDEKQKIDLLSHARALLFYPRWLESYGIVVTEALASGCPCILGGSGGHMEQITHGVEGFKCHSMDDFESAVGMIDRIDPENCRRRSEYFSSARMAEDWEKAIREIAGDRV
ncbi:MAG: glycosyltransferase [Nitrososphaerota archaeon]